VRRSGWFKSKIRMMSLHQNGMEVNVFKQKLVKAVEAKKFEAYIGRKEVLVFILKDFFPNRCIV
jgi:hypothetical protein